MSLQGRRERRPAVLGLQEPYARPPLPYIHSGGQSSRSRWSEHEMSRRGKSIATESRFMAARPGEGERVLMCMGSPAEGMEVFGDWIKGAGA